jgi:hypothetical protein
MKLQIIVEHVLEHHVDDNLVSEEARKKIAEDIVSLFLSTPVESYPTEELLKKGIVNFYKEKQL